MPSKLALAEMVRLRVQGMSIPEIARVAGVSHQAVSKRLRRVAARAAVVAPVATPHLHAEETAVEELRLHRELVEGELLAKYRTASREFEASLASGDAPGARAWLSRLTPILIAMGRAVGLDNQPEVSVAVGVAVKPQEMAQGLLDIARKVLPLEHYLALRDALEASP